MVAADRSTETPEGDLPDDRSRRGWLSPSLSLIVLAGGLTITGIVLRFVAPSSLWLDEALSVNIAALPISEIPEALRHDGHPPAYYVLLHLWMDLFGSSDVATRALSGIWGVLLMGLAWVAGRRLADKQTGWLALALVASSPYAIRYATEVRMYSMVAALALLGWLLAGEALRRPTWWRLGALAAVVGLGLWTHYWVIWLLGGAAVALMVRWWRLRGEGDVEAQVRTAKVLGSLVVGGILFLPWVPSFLFQATHTGTPWARPMRPTEIVHYTIEAFGGGALPEAILLGYMLAVLAVIGLHGRHDGNDLRLVMWPQPTARPLALTVVTTLALGCLAGYASGTTYQPRYGAVVFGMFMLLGVLGLRLVSSGWLGVGLLAGICALGVGVAVLNLREERSDAARNADAIETRAEVDDLVVYCPDQLGPSTSRALATPLRQITFPDMAPPERVDWVDYHERLEAASVAGFADRVVTEADGAAIFLVFSPNYSTHEQLCPELVDAFSAHREGETLTGHSDAYEPATVVRFGPD